LIGGGGHWSAWGTAHAASATNRFFSQIFRTERQTEHIRFCILAIDARVYSCRRNIVTIECQGSEATDPCENQDLLNWISRILGRFGSLNFDARLVVRLMAKSENHDTADARQAAKRAIDALVIQFRIERMTTRLGWIALAVFVLALILALLQKPIIRMVS
jgi:hypothetical protein